MITKFEYEKRSSRQKITTPPVPASWGTASILKSYWKQSPNQDSKPSSQLSGFKTLIPGNLKELILLGCNTLRENQDSSSEEEYEKIFTEFFESQTEAKKREEI